MRWIVIVSLCLALCGCGEKQQPAAPVAPVEKEEAAKPQAAAASETVKEPVAEAATPRTEAKPVDNSPSIVGTPPEAFNFPEPPLEMPPVLLSGSEAKSCLVNVGDAMPDFALADLAGKSQSLSKSLGKKLTIVTFWTDRNPYSIEQLGELGPGIVAQFPNDAIQVVMVSEGLTAAAAKSIVEKAGADFVNLVDDGKAFAKVATGRLPRTYLLDSNGKILWFDIEYSRSTRRDLLRAIHFALRDAKSA